ncbi:MAG: VanZ family protein [Clostridiales bacterium]|nr:VanZ family protein [Clostridiales bacterium]
MIALLVGAVAFIIFRNGKINGASCITSALLAFYLSFVAEITIFSRNPSDYTEYKFDLFWSYSAIADGSPTLLAQVIWNIILFIPIGLLLMKLLTLRNKWVISVLCGFVLSSVIEVFQLILHRGWFELDDIFHNTIGTIIGIVIYILVSRLFSVFLRCKN